MKKNDYFIGECESYTHEGIGVVKHDGKVIFVKGMLKDEVGQIKIIKEAKNYLVGRLIELQVESKNRIQPPCLVAKVCGGCQLQHMNETEQAFFKHQKVVDTLKRIGGIDQDVEPVIMMEEPWYYRNKTQIPVGYQDEQIVAGFYKQRTHEIIPISECMIQNHPSNEINQIILRWMMQYHIKPYDESKHKGMIRHLLVKYGYHTNELMVVLVSTTFNIPHLDELIEMLKKEVCFKTLVINLNTDKTNAIIGEKEKVIYGTGVIKDQINHLSFKISPKSFFQINPYQVGVLYQSAIDMAKLNKEDRVLDVYCGIGTITLNIAKHVNHVTGIEIIKEAIEDAKQNALLNNLTNTSFKAEDAKTFMLDNKNQFDVVFVDPPRKGCHPDVLNALIDMKPRTIVYVSCDVATLARDLKILSSDYKIEKIQPVDMFPQTYHIETAVLLREK